LSTLSQLTPLTPEEAYLAAMHDVALAHMSADYAIKHRGMPVAKRGEFLGMEIARMWSKRIERGQLPPVEETAGNAEREVAR
jgi:hypothetical protein